MDKIGTLKFEDVLCMDTPHPVSFVIDWNIPHYSFLKESTDRIKSNPFVIGKFTWSLSLTPKYNRSSQEGTKPCALIRLHHSPCPESSIYSLRVKVAKVGFIDAADDYVLAIDPTSAETKNLDLKPGRNSSEAICWAVLDHELIPVAVGDSLKLRAEVTYMSLLVTPLDRLLIPKLQTLDIDPFRQALKTLYETNTGRDFVLVSSDGLEEFVHRAILIARSPVFAAMFESNMTEVQTGRCVISDVSRPVLKALVKYMYCGCSGEDFGGDAMNVLLMADKYQLTELVNYCEQLLIRTVSKDNVIEILLLTDGVLVPALKKAALRFLSTHTDDLSDLKKSGAFKKLAEEASTELLAEIITFLV